MTMTGTATQQVLAEMMVENTGKALCDSGDAYGRHWEENKGRDLRSFIEAPDAVISEWGEGEFGYVIVDVFHYLDNRVEYDLELTEEFTEFAELPENKDVGWLWLMEEWAESKSDSGDRETFNSYNAENLLSQTIQGTVFEIGGEWYVLLQIHGGCDVRGGYTAPRVFRINTERGAGDWYDLIWGVNSFTITAGEGFSYSLREGDWQDNNTYDLCDEPDFSLIVKRDGVWVHKETGHEVNVFADNEW